MAYHPYSGKEAVQVNKRHKTTMNPYKNMSVEQIIGREKAEYEEIEFIEPTDNGILVWLKGHPHPTKGLPTPDALYATNIVKKMMRAWRPWHSFKSLKEITHYVLKTYYFHDNLKTPATKATQKILHTLFTELNLPDASETFAHIIEFDEAYRFRLQDLAQEYSQDNNPRKELKRILDIHHSRDYNEISEKFKLLATLALLALYLPNVQKAVKKALTYLPELYPDESDLYWMKQKQDYEYRAKSSSNSKESNGLLQ